MVMMVMIAPGRELNLLLDTGSMWSECPRNIDVVDAPAVCVTSAAEWPDCSDWPATCWRVSRAPEAAATATTTNRRMSCGSSKTARSSDNMADRNAIQPLPVAMRRCRLPLQPCRCLPPLCRRSSESLTKCYSTPRHPLWYFPLPNAMQHICHICTVFKFLV